jgi:hypothetical protein
MAPLQTAPAPLHRPGARHRKGQNDPNKRHVPVEGHKGFYWKDGRQLEVGFRYRDSDNRRQYAYGSMPQFGGRPWNLSDAKKAYGRLNVSIERQEVVVSAKARTFKEVREEWKETRAIDGRTAEARDSNLKLYAGPFERVKVRDIQEPQILKWLNGLRSARNGQELAEGTLVSLGSPIILRFLRCTAATSQATRT